MGKNIPRGKDGTLQTYLAALADLKETRRDIMMVEEGIEADLFTMNETEVDGKREGKKREKKGIAEVRIKSQFGR